MTPVDRFNTRVSVHIRDINRNVDVVKEFSELQAAYMWIDRNTDSAWTRKSFMELSNALDEAVLVYGVRLGSVCAAFNDVNRILVYYGVITL